MLWLILILTPVLLACLAWTPIMHRGTFGLMLAGGAIPALGVAVGLVPAQEAEFEWLLLDALLGLDAVRTIWLALAAVLWFVAGAFAGGYLANDAKRNRFGFYFLLAMAGNFALIVAGDAATFYSGFVVMTFAAYGLVVHNGSREALRAGRIYLVMAILGELFIVPAIYLSVQGIGSTRLDEIGFGLAGLENRDTILLLGLVGFGVKVGAVPLYFWLPLAHPVAPTPASAVLSGCMIKAGLLGWLHFSPLGTVPFSGWSTLVIVAGVIAAFLAVVLGLFQSDPKTNLAYSSVSQMGWMTVLFGVGLNAGTEVDSLLAVLALYVLNHGLAKGALFLGTGLHPVKPKHRRWVMAGLILPAAAIAGAPLTLGAWVKYGVKDAFEQAPGGWGVALEWLLPLSALGTSMLLGRFLWIWWNQEGHGARASAPIVGYSWMGLLFLVMLMPILGGALVEMPIPSPGLALMGLLDAAWPILIAALLLWAAARGVGGRLLARLPRIPPGDLIVGIEALLVCVRDRTRRWAPASELEDSSTPLDWMVGRFRIVTEWTEPRLGYWTVLGPVFMVIVLIIVLLL
jgi:formate hydrogenlyase subunit 3/multisubunit Na+/H+ antiporter MnhD subunit